MNTELINYLKVNIALDEQQLTLLLSKFERRQLNKDRHLIKKGQIVDCYYFIESGFLRSYYTCNEKEHTVWIEAPGELVVDIKSLRLQQPTDYSIVTLEPVVYHRIKAAELDKLIVEIKSLQTFMQRLWETRFIIALDGLRAFQTLDAKQRYQFLEVLS